MKLLLVVALLCWGAWAQEEIAPSAEEDAQMFAQMKEFSTKQTTIMLPIMKQMRQCYEKADSKSELVRCFKAIKDIQQISEEMDINAIEEDPEFVWNAQTRKEVIGDLDEIVKEIGITSGCMKTSKNFDTYEACLAEHGIGE